MKRGSAGSRQHPFQVARRNVFRGDHPFTAVYHGGHRPSHPQAKLLAPALFLFRQALGLLPQRIWQQARSRLKSFHRATFFQDKSMARPHGL
jgi:hypothetical protein